MTRESVEISSDEEQLSGGQSLRERNTSYIYKHRFGSVELHAPTLKCLNNKSYLTDNIIQFYCAYLLSELCPEEFASRIHIFDSIFHKQLEGIFHEKSIESKKLRHLISKWLNNIDIFEKQYLIFPVCSDDHWFAIVVCYPSLVPDPESSDYNGIKQAATGDTSILKNGKQTPGIFVMDSLRRSDKGLITSRVRSFLDFAWRDKLQGVKNFGYHNLIEYSPKLPQQTNAFDCGIFMMAYIRCFVEQPERFYRLVRRDNDDSRETLKIKVEGCLQDCGRESIKSLVHKLTKANV